MFRLPEDKIVTTGRLLIFLWIMGFSVTTAAAESAALGISFDHVALSVEDIDRAAEFYESVFGLEEIINRTEIEGIRWYALGEDKELHLISIDYSPVSVNQSVHFALTTPFFDEFIETLRERKIPYADYTGTFGKIAVRADGARQIYIQDPDGYWIEVNSTAAD